MDTSTATATPPIKRKSSNVLGRPTGTYSRRKFCEAIKCLKGIIRNERTNIAPRLRAIELLCMVYGVYAPESKRDVVSVKELVQEHTFEKQLHIQLDKRLAEQDAERLSQEQADAEAAQDRQQRDTFAAVLSLGE